MTQKQFDGLKSGDKVWIKGTVSHQSSLRGHYLVDIPYGRVTLVENEFLHEVELELPRHSAPEGYEEFWPRSATDVEIGHRWGQFDLTDRHSTQFRCDGEFWAHFEAMRRIGLPFYRPIKKEPEVEPYTRETWRSVNDILPPPRTTILLWGYFDKEDAHCFDGQMFFDQDGKPVFHLSCMPAKVSHWKPLPEAPPPQGGAL